MNAPAFHVRRATQADAPTMAALEHLTIPEFMQFVFGDLKPGTSAGALAAAHYARPGPDSYEWTWLAELDDGGAPVGFLTAYPLALAPPTPPQTERAAHMAPFRAALPEKSGALLTRVGAHPALRRAGVTTALWDAAAAAFDPRDSVYAFTWSDNTPMQGFLKKAGFAQTGSVYIAPHPKLSRSGESLLFCKGGRARQSE